MSAEEIQLQKSLVQVGSSGLLLFNNNEELKLAANFAMQTDLAPKQIKDKGLAAVCAALLACKQYNLPQKAMGQMGYINGKITFYGSLYTAIAERHPDYGERKVFFVDVDSKKICFANQNLSADVFGCVIQAKRKSDVEFNEFFFTMNDAENAGLYDSKKSSGHLPWYKYTKDMLYHKTNKRCQDALYASALEGINYHEDLIGVFSEEREVGNEIKELKEILDARKLEDEVQKDSGEL